MGNNYSWIAKHFTLQLWEKIILEISKHHMGKFSKHFSTCGWISKHFTVLWCAYNLYKSILYFSFEISNTLVFESVLLLKFQSI